MSSLWKEAQAPDGRKYWYHSVTKKTTWEKPADVDQPSSASPEIDAAWREARAQDGKVYYYNSITNVTQWEAPEAYLRQQQNAPAQAPQFVAGSGGYDGRERRNSLPRERRGSIPRDQGGSQRAGGAVPWEGFRGPMIKSDEPEYASPEQAEEAFFKLLKRFNVTPSTSWIDALKLTAKEREYRAIKEPKERKDAFEKYIKQVKEEHKVHEQERKEKMREDFKRMLTKHDEITHATRWKTARPSIEQEAVFKQAGDDEEFRKQMFSNYIMELKKQRIEQDVSARSTAMEELEKLISTLIVDANSAWSSAQSIITDNERFTNDERFRVISKLDILNVYDKHIKELDHITNNMKQKQKGLRIREQRKAREGFVSLLEGLAEQGKIKAGSKWTDIFPLLRDEPAYDAILGTSGSDPLNLFWDVVERQERELRGKRNACLDVLDDKRYEMTVDTTVEEFKSVMIDDDRTNAFTNEEYQQIYDRLREKILKRAEDDKKDAERYQRKAIDSLRSVIRHLDPPIRGDDRYQDIEPRLVKYPEYQDLDDESRHAAFDKQLRRVREREDDERRRREARERRHRTRTPEVDAYEADRRKAQAERERHYRGGRAPSFGLSPSRETRRSVDRYDDRYSSGGRRYSSGRRESIYERERREREIERERTYVSRADPRDKGRTLDYGDEDAVGSSSRPGSVRKRRDSDDGSAVGKKRSRNAKTPEAMDVDAKEEVALQSGSEEGEIEEV